MHFKFSGAHVTEFINLWCDFCNKLVEQGDIKKLIPIFIELYVVGERNKDLDKVIINIFENFSIETVLELTDSQNIALIKSSYCHYKFINNNFTVSDEFSTSSIVDARRLLQNNETEDRGWLVVRRSLALCKNKDLARESLSGVITELGVKS